MKTIGILGGMGPKATAALYSRIVDLTAAETDQDHVQALIYSNSKIPNRVDAILKNDVQDVANQLRKSAKILSDGGADFIVVACNTAHFWLDEIRDAVDIPVLDMVGETLEFLARQDRSIEKVGLICSPGTAAADVYRRKGAEIGIEVLYPSPPLLTIASNFISRLKVGEPTQGCVDASKELIDWFKEQNAQRVVLGCTELPFIYDVKNPYFVDPIDIISKVSISYSGAKLSNIIN